MHDIVDIFKKICKIPRQSGGEARIGDFLIKCAEDYGLQANRDNFNNIVILKPSTISGYAGKTVILQGHMDMVYVKAEGSNHCYADGIDVIEKDGFLCSSADTSLGSDNGIALAYMVALFGEQTTPLPAIEFVITAKEEVGLEGAQAFDASTLRGKYFINLDSEEEGVFFTSCAGGVRCRITLITEFEEKTGTRVNLKTHGLRSGHSGLDIHKQHANAIKLAERIIRVIPNGVNVESLVCKGRANIIAQNADITFISPPNILSKLRTVVSVVEEELATEFRFTDDISLSLDYMEDEVTALTYRPKSTSKLSSLLNLIPNGALSMSLAVPGIVQTSCNWGSVEQLENGLYVCGAIRSLSGIEKRNCMMQIETICQLLPGCTVEFTNNYPEWEISESERLRKICADAYEKCIGKKAVFTAIHAGLECGYFAEKLPGCELISFGPNQYDVHTTKERVELRSVFASFDTLLAILHTIAYE
jgi:dipeptidase D